MIRRLAPAARMCRSFQTGRSACEWDNSKNADAPAAGEIEIRIAPLPRGNESDDVKRARLVYQSRKRGILETDLLLSKFAKLYLNDMTRPELDEYDKLLDEQDWDIYYWASEAEGSPPAPPRWDGSPVLQKLREMTKEKHPNEVLRMPDL